MPLRDLANADMSFIVQGDFFGWRWAIELTDPDGNVSNEMYGLTNDVSLFIDPGTGQPISGRQASIAIVIAEVANQGLNGMPEGISDTASLPWVVKFLDVNGESYTFRVVSSEPDRTLGLLVCILEVYNDTP